MRSTTTRRELMRLAALAGAGIAGLSVMANADGEKTAGRHRPTIDFSGYPFDHVKALIDGTVEVPECTLKFQPGKIGDLNTHVFSGPQTLGFTEIGLSPFMLAYANEGFRDYSLLPVFPLRLFRHKSIFVHTDRGIDSPADLKGRRIGTPGYASTSLTWIRGTLQDEYAVSPEDVEWVVSAADSSAGDAGKVSQQESVVPAGIRIETGPPGKDESDLLLDGDVDALFHAAEPRAFTEGNPKVRRLFSDSRQVEQAYFRQTGIFPIMHAVAIRNDLADEYPRLPAAVFNAYSAAKQLQYDKLERQWIFGTLPWFGQELDATRALMGENFWPYGIEPNHKTLETLFRYSYEQGLASRKLTIEELFLPATLELRES